MPTPNYLRSLQVLDQYRNRPRTTGNMTLERMAPPAPGGYAGAKIGGGLRLRGPAALDALNAPAQVAPQAPPAYFNPKSPVYSQEQLAGASRSGFDASLEVERRSKYGTAAIPAMEQRIDFNGNPVPGLRPGSQSRAPVAMDMEKRQAYLDRVAGVQAGRDKLVLANAQQQLADRRSRLSRRAAGPSTLDLLAQRNPKMALALAQLNQQGALGREQLASRERLGAIQFGGQSEKQKAEAAVYSAMAQNPTLLALNAAGGLPADATMADFNRIAGGGGAASGTTALGALGTAVTDQADQMDLPRAIEALEAQGASPQAVQNYISQRQDSNRPGLLGRAANALSSAPPTSQNVWWQGMSGVGDFAKNYLGAGSLFAPRRTVQLGGTAEGREAAAKAYTETLRQRQINARKGRRFNPLPQ